MWMLTLKAFTRLVISSLRPLKEVAQESGVPLQNLTVQQVVKWYEKEGSKGVGE